MSSGKGASRPTPGEPSPIPGKRTEMKSLMWCRWIARRPKLMFGVTGGVHVSFIIITAALWAANYNILPLVFDDLPLELNNDVTYLRNEAWENRDEEIDDVKTASNTSSRRKRWASPPYEILDQHPMSSQSHEDPFIDHRSMQLKINLNTLDDQSQAATAQWLGNSHDVFDFENQFSTRMWAKRWKRNTPIGARNDSNLQNSTTESSDDNTQQIVDSWEEEAKDDVRERQKSLTSLTIIYEAPGGNVFTAENLRKIAELEYRMYNMKEFQLKYCRLISFAGGRICQPFSSVLRYFDGSFSDTHEDLFDPNFRNVSKVLNLAYSHLDTKDQFTYFIGRNRVFNSSRGIAQSKITRTLITYGYPLRSYGNSTDRREEQLRKFGNWFSGNVKPMLQRFSENDKANMKLYFINFRIYYNDVFAQVFEDWKLLIGAFAFIFLFTWFQTGSLWITGMGITSIMTSFLGANLIYNVICGYKYFGIFNVMAIFIVLGIGADDIFIFSDNWVASEKYSQEKLEHRLSVCFKKAAVAMFVTSLTTMTAFFLSGLSPILPIAGFGVFAGFTILVNYISVITFFPTVIIIYHLYFERKRCLCCCERPKDEIEEELAEATYENASMKSSGNESTSGVGEKGSFAERPRNFSVNGYVVYCFANPFYRLVTHRVGRWVVLLLFLGLVGGCIYLATAITLEDSRVKMFGPNHVQEIALNRLTYDFAATEDERRLRVRLVWGLCPQDKTMCNTRAYEQDNPCLGKTVWKPEFNMNNAESQEALLNFCRKMQHLKGPEQDKLKIYYYEKTNTNNVTCFMEPLYDFVKNESNKPQYPPGVKLQFPITMETAQNIIKYNPDVYRAGAEKIITHPFEVVVDYWLNNGYTNDTVPDEILLQRSYLGFRNLNRYNLAYNEDDDGVGGIFGSTTRRRTIFPRQLMYMSMELTIQYRFRDLPLVTGLPYMATWEDFISTEMQRLPGPLKGGFQTSPAWVWFRVLQSIIYQGVLSVGVGLCLAFVVIFLGTQNIITALLSVTCLACVCVCVFAVLPLMGWKFGLIEAMNTCLVVGLAVDYVVHTAEGYHMNRFTARKDRLRDALQHVGISVLSGAITTAGASFFMLFAQILFFQQFGMFIFSTIVLSILFSLFPMATLFGMIGPQGYTGSFLKICRREKAERYVKSHDNAAFKDDSTKM